MTFLLTLKRCSRYFTLVLLAVAGMRCLAQDAGVQRSAPPIGKSWPTYNGDMTGRRYSGLDQINKDNVHLLTLAWAFPTRGDVLKSTPLVVHGVLYFTAPNYVWAVDAQTGEEVWTYHRPAPGDDIGQRGVAFYKNRVYFGTTDAHLICLDARDGKPLWNVEIADVKLGYYISTAPLILGGRVLVGTSGDQTNIPHFLEAVDWETGAEIWRTSSLPEPGGPGSNTWPNAATMSHGGGPMWLSGTYDPKLNLVYWGTGNPHPVLDGRARSGANLYTACILAINPDTGKIVWYFQASPHDTHDWDAVETPVLFDGNFGGKPRRMLAQASRNGYFFVLDRATGKNLVSRPYLRANWSLGVDAQGSPIPNSAKEPQPDGALVKSPEDGGTNWMPPSFDPETGLFYFTGQYGYTIWYLALDENGDAVDHEGGGAVGEITQSALVAIDYRTGKIRWKRDAGEGGDWSGVLTTAGHLLFTGDASGNVLALDPADGKVLWHVRAGGNVRNGPMTYMLNGRQYVVTGVNNILYAWALPGGQ
jgi:alcohol dehydrogenase (cytochrome c)